MPKKFSRKSCVSSDDSEELTDLASKIDACSIRSSASTSSSFAAANRKNRSPSWGRKFQKSRSSVNVGSSTSGYGPLSSAPMSRPTCLTKFTNQSTTVPEKSTSDKIYTKECRCKLPPFQVAKTNKPVCVVKGVQRNRQIEHRNSGDHYSGGRHLPQVEFIANLMSQNRQRLGSYELRMNEWCL